jgi:hypothetical protein
MIGFARILLGIFVAAVAAPLMIGVVSAVSNMLEPGATLAGVRGTVLFSLAFGFPVTLALLLVTALPAYLLLRRRYPMRWWHAGLAGLVIGMGIGVVDNMGWQSIAVASLTGLSCGLLFRAVIGRDPRDTAPS